MKTVVSIVLNDFTHDSRVLKENISLKNAGYSPIVVALHEPGLSELDSRDGIGIRRIRLITKKLGKNLIFQLLKYFEFILRVAVEFKDYDVFHCNDLNTLPVGVLIKLIFNRKASLIYDAHELETDLAGETKFRKTLAKLLERVLIKFSDHIFVVSESIADWYEHTYKISRPTVILNAPRAFPVQKSNYLREYLKIPNDQKILVYVGRITSGRGVELLLKAFAQRPKTDCVVVFLGYGPLKDLVLQFAKDYSNIHYHHAVPENEVLPIIASADAGAHFIENACLSYYFCLPNKLFECAMAGLPCVVSDLKEMKRFVVAHEIGLVVKEMTPHAINEVIDQLLKSDLFKMGENARKVAEENSWEKQEIKMLTAYNELAEK